MNNWNYDQAAVFVEKIENPISQRLTKLLLDSIVLYVAQKKGYPEAEFDLLFFVKAITPTTACLPLFHKILSGQLGDEGWEAVADEMSKRLPVSEPLHHSPVPHIKPSTSS